MKAFKAMVFGLTLLGGAVLNQTSAGAATCQSLSGQTVSAIDALPACTVMNGTVSFDISSYSPILAGATVQFVNNSTTLSFTVFTPNIATSGTSGNIIYTLTGAHLAGVRVDSTTNLTPTTVTKSFRETPLTLVSQNGADTPTAPGFAPLQYAGSTLTVSDAFVVGVEGDLASFSNAFVVPEPATMALMGIGLVGLGYARRRRNA